MRVAFKEWAVVVDALGRGDQILIFRKGGLDEPEGEFQLETPRFLLFPTFFHQQREGVIPAAQARFDEIQRGFPPPNLLRLEYSAEVVFSRRIWSLEEAQRLKGQHIWSDEIIARRFDWGGNRSIFVMAARIFCLALPIELPMSTNYGGCKSWVELEQNVTTENAAPVTSEMMFESKMEQFRTALNLPRKSACCQTAPGSGID